jgi:hypothetical protein
MRLDLAFLGRDSRPIPVSSAREIEKRATWGAFVEDCKMVAGVLGIVALTWALWMVLP